MTAEIVVMNKTAVALAADSAATIEARNAKIYNSAEKLFMLVPGQPIAIMVYNYSEFMQLPWETIIKKFRVFNNGKTYKKLEDYSKSFFSFLSNSKNGLYSDEQLEVSFRIVVQYYLDKIAENIISEVEDKIQTQGKKISKEEIANIISEWINRYYEKWRKEENLYSQDEIKNVVQKFTSMYGEILDSHINTTFGSSEITANDREKIVKFIYSLFYKKNVSDFYTGVVIAGFGEDDLYPSCEEYLVENYFCNHLKMIKVGHGEITPSNTGMIVSFAQKDVVQNFLNGIHPGLEDILRFKIGDLLNESDLLKLEEIVKDTAKYQKEKFHKAFMNIRQSKTENLVNDVKEAFMSKHTDSILNAVSALPKDELAQMAESLVNLTSFMRRVSMDLETVGGPIDVAVISKKDGFIWIKRKHYFDQKYNIHFGK